ncbi:hypothetical protein [Streptomyces sp. H27-D2]|uniref:hypothetical protein n=1 Tax=Streptomyces sp. H27-D2 TaxID=3046304 RepID=UPI002DBB16E9|nr:hypothetical protein [Streptomyces sp. H27-D2]MEC4017666.1 hypothetical protein [Streptomyces sp. H27-D2]
MSTPVKERVREHNPVEDAEDIVTFAEFPGFGAQTALATVAATADEGTAPRLRLPWEDEDLAEQHIWRGID